MLKDPQILCCLPRFDRDFIALAHPHQEPPVRANGGGDWTTWLMLSGRGAGKTGLGAEWVRAMAHGVRPYAESRSLQIALVGETEHDVREVMIEGPAGLLRISPRSERPEWIASRRRPEWPNGAVGFTFSAEDPEQLRGPQFAAAWCDELAKWRHVDATFDMLTAIRPAPGPTPAPAHRHHAAADPADQASHRRSADGGDAGVDTRQRRASVARLSRRGACPRGSAARRSTARSSRSALTRYGRARSSRHRALPQRRHSCVSSSASILRVRRARARMHAASSQPALPKTSASTCLRMRPSPALRLPATKAVALFHRLKADAMVAEVNWAATWCGPCWRRSIPQFRCGPCTRRAASSCAPSPSP